MSDKTIIFKNDSIIIQSEDPKYEYFNEYYDTVSCTSFEIIDNKSGKKIVSICATCEDDVMFSVDKRVDTELIQNLEKYLGIAER